MHITCIHSNDIEAHIATGAILSLIQPVVVSGILYDAKQLYSFTLISTACLWCNNTNAVLLLIRDQSFVMLFMQIE